ncbi:MAG: hypothetical protein HQL66_14555 [Magnetococcales bacterium]|nr:hypothetical protein [Magnetococcales bacterium]
MAESDDDDVTIVNARGAASRGQHREQEVQDRRRFPRPRFRAPSLLTMESGAILKGMTEDVSYQGIRFTPETQSGVFHVLGEGDPGVIRVSLNLLLPLDACYVDINCRVVRTGGNFVALRIEPPQSPGSMNRSFPKVFVRRSNGILEPDWEILPRNVLLPEDVQRRIRRHEEKYASFGPVAVVCRKRGGRPEDDLYKLHNIQYLKEIQEFATRDQDPNKVYDPPTGWG